MTWLRKMERKFGKYAIANLSTYMIICYGFGFILQIASRYANNDVLNYFTLNPYWILHGQIWRLVTWVLVPSEGFGIFTLIMLYFYWSIGTTLERTWGTFIYNIYIFGGLLSTIIGAFVFYVICELTQGYNVPFYGVLYEKPVFYGMIFSMFGTYYVCMSIFLAFAMSYPDMQVILMFIIPIKVKVLGIIYAIILGFELVSNLLTTASFWGKDGAAYLTLAQAVSLAFSMLACLIFFIVTRKSFRTPTQIKRQRQFKRQVQAHKISKHKCAICGRTDEEYPDLEFRFCSKCNGNYEYCQEHLFTHKHI